MKAALIIFSAFVLAGFIFLKFGRSTLGSRDSYDWRADPKVWEYHRNELKRIHAELGKTPREILAKQGSVERRKLFDALQTLCSWKSLNNVPLNDLENFIVISTGLGMEVNNGGFYQYFFNSTADDWDVMLEGMRKAGDETGVKRFETVLARFPGGKPSKVRTERWKQLDSFGDGQYKVFDGDTSAFFDNPFPDWEKIWLYVIANIERIEPLAVESSAGPNERERGQAN